MKIPYKLLTLICAFVAFAQTFQNELSEYLSFAGTTATESRKAKTKRKRTGDLVGGSIYGPENCCHKDLYIWPSARRKGLNNQINVLMMYISHAANMRNSAAVILPPIESNFDTAKQRNKHIRLQNLTHVKDHTSGSYLAPFEILFNVTNLRSTLLGSEDHKACVMSETEARDVCGLNLKNTSVVKREKYSNLIGAADLLNARFDREDEEMWQNLTTERLEIYRDMQTVTSNLGDPPAALVRTDNPLFMPKNVKNRIKVSTRVTRRAYDWFQKLQGLVAYGLMKPGTLLEQTLTEKIKSRGPYNGLHLRIEKDLGKDLQLPLKGIIDFLQKNQIPKHLPLYIAHAGSIEPYRAEFAEAGYNITSKAAWVPEIISIAKKHREILGRFEQLVLFGSEYFVGTSVSSLSFYVMAARNEMVHRHSLDYLPRGRPHIDCCNSGIPYENSALTASAYTARELYTICLWADQSDGSATGGSAIFMTLLKQEFERRGHLVVFINKARRDKKLRIKKLGPKDFDLHILNQNQYPAKLMAKYLSRKKTGKAKVLMRSDGPFALHRGKPKQDEALFSTVVKYCDTLIYQSEWSKEATRKRVPYLKKVPSTVNQVVVNNAADPFVFFPPEEGRQIGANTRLRVGTSVWSPHPRKNFKLIELLVPLLDPKLFELVIIGNIPDDFDRSAFEEKNFTLYPPVNQHELGLLLRNRIDAFLAPSWNECFSNSEIQALSSGLPVVALNDSSHMEAVGEGGLFFGSSSNSADVEGALQALHQLRADYDHYVSLINPPTIRSIAKQYLEAAGLVG